MRAEVIFKTCSFFNSVNSNSLLETKSTEQFFIADWIRTTSYDSPVTQTSCFCATMLNSSQENPPQGDLQRDLFHMGLALQTEVDYKCFVFLHMVKTLWTSLSPPQISQSRAHTFPAMCLSAFCTCPCPNCSQPESPKLCLQLPGTHPLYSKDEKKVTQMSAIHQMPFPHEFSRMKQKSDWEPHTKNAWLCPPWVCRKCSNTEDSSTENTPDSEFWEKEEQPKDY